MDPGGFRERALHEARRYGPDRWVFVRELLQNARDAGARSVDISVREADGRSALIACRDDGCGMTVEHARRYLFALYASSKEGRKDAAGRFGVGFWSVLRFEPARILVRSWPRRGEPWEVELDGGLTRAMRRLPPVHATPGTEIVLERAAGDGALSRRIADAVWQSARFLARRDDPERPLAIRVNGRSANARFDLPAPSALFRRGGLRGAVGLGAEARVELFAKGLRVRSAACLEDLLGPDGRSSDATRTRFPEVGDGLAPQALLDGRDLEVLLARGDARETPALRRLLGLARDELARLVDRQLALVRPEPLWRRAARAASGVPGVAATVALAALAFGAGVSWGRRATGGLAPSANSAPAVAAEAMRRPSAPGSTEPPAVGAHALRLSAPDDPLAYHDLAAVYRGPETDALDGPTASVALRYRPEQLTLRFAALVVPLGADTAVVGPALPYRGEPCAAACVDVALAVADGPGPLRLPVPTGHRLDAASVRLDGGSVPVLSSPEDEPLLALERPTRAIVTYRTSPGAPAQPAAATSPAADLPEPLRAEARELRSLGVDERVFALTARVRGLITYSNARDVVVRERAQAARGVPFARRALAVGAGDCDVQNGLLALLLTEAGVTARLVVGYQGASGSVAPGLHAWVEYRDGAGPWRVADASSAAGALPESVGPPAADGPSVAPRLDVPATAAPGTSPGGALLRGVGGSVLVVAAAAGLGLVARRRTRRDVRLDPAHEPVRLLRGALQQPGAFADVPAVFDRRLVPLLGGGATSLRSAWEQAARGRLLASRAGSPLARRAARSGVAVLDAAREEARVVADALGAVDLDSWAALLARARSPALLEAAAAELRRCGKAWDVRLAAEAGGLTLLELPSRRCLGPGFRAGRVLVVDAAEATWAEAVRLAERRPREALLRVADSLADRLSLAGQRRARLLAPLAAAALEEAIR